MLELAGWIVQDMHGLDFTASRGVAIREFPLEAGFADYMLFVDRHAVGIVEAKKEGTSLSGVDTQSRKYLDGLPPHVQRVETPLPFAYESTGVETVFRDVRDPDYRSRRVFSFHRPGTLMDWAREPETLRARLKGMPPLATAGLRECQIEAIDGLEHSLSENRPRSLGSFRNSRIWVCRSCVVSDGIPWDVNGVCFAVSGFGDTLHVEAS